ncbi:hypothetical protein ELQ92_00885 [Labedella populi]|uniref:Uncharacterized protein n=1 Tax=Labedella populi TaxID=2498850 RepID=A0A3S4EC35_9MICO|nr:hypothetical protein [Labedella populi]RWZ67858.1 hypothetical protein ELQ92_00885 [Labedella populi]
MTKDIEGRWAALTAQFPPSAPGRPADSGDDVRPGQVREAIWGRCEATVLVVGVDDDAAEVTVNPVSLEPGVADVNALVLEGEDSPLRGRVAIWPNVHATMSFIVLHDVVAELREDVTHRVLSGAHKTRAAGFGHGDSPRFGAMPLPASGAAIAFNRLLDSIDELALVRPQRSQTPKTHQTIKFPLSLSALMETLGITQAVAMSVIKGQRELTLDQAEAVANVAGVPVADVLAAARPLPDDLERELMEPRWRAVIRARAGTRGEAGAREELGRSAFALAARGKGSGRELWRQRIQAMLAAEDA